MSAPDAATDDLVLVVDVANVVGSRPDGWWRDRAGAASRLLAALAALAGLTPLPAASVTDPTGRTVRVSRVVAVVEGAAREVPAPGGVEVVRAARDGDSEIVAQATQLVSRGERVLVVTADRGLRARLPRGCSTTGPRWLTALLGRE